jgi:hypothetical protein
MLLLAVVVRYFLVISQAQS